MYSETLCIGTAPDFAMRDGAAELRHKAKMWFYREGTMFRQEAPNDRSFVKMLGHIKRFLCSEGIKRDSVIEWIDEYPFDLTASWHDVKASLHIDLPESITTQKKNEILHYFLKFLQGLFPKFSPNHPQLLK